MNLVNKEYKSDHYCPISTLIILLFESKLMLQDIKNLMNPE